MEGFVSSHYFEERGDTYFGMPWNDFLKLLESKGFKKAYSREFEAFNYEGKVISEEEVIFFDEGKGLILYAESYNRKLLSFAKVFGEVYSSGENFGDEQLEALVVATCAHWGNGNGTMSLNFQSDEGLFFCLEVLERAFNFSSVWHSGQQLNLLNRSEIKAVSREKWGSLSEKKLKGSRSAKKILGMIA